MPSEVVGFGDETRYAVSLGFNSNLGACIVPLNTSLSLIGYRCLLVRIRPPDGDDNYPWNPGLPTLILIWWTSLRLLVGEYFEET